MGCISVYDERNIMMRFPKLAATAAVVLGITACSGNEAPDADDVTETQMDEVDVIDGTISDEMVDVDTMQAEDATGNNSADLPDDQEGSETDSATAETPTE